MPKRATANFLSTMGLTALPVAISYKKSAFIFEDSSTPGLILSFKRCKRSFSEPTGGVFRSETSSFVNSAFNAKGSTPAV